MILTLHISRETDGRFIADVTDIPGCVAYGATREEAIKTAKALSLRVLADRLVCGEADVNSITFKVLL